MNMKSWMLNGSFGCGCDYNPDQWLETPEIIDQDIEIMQQLGINTVNLGIFSWSRLEPVLGDYDFTWLNAVLDKLDAANIAYFMATPGAAFPPYLAHIYPEVLRVDRNGCKHQIVDRNNYCLTSPVLRKRLMLVCDKLAREIRHRPGLLGWHLNNELSGECCCELCVNEWRKFLRSKYCTTAKLNQAWWSDFSGNRFVDWCEIPPVSNGNKVLPGMHLDWQRFVTLRQLDYLMCEKEAVTYWTPDLPVTHNSWRVFGNFDWRKFAPELDFVSADVYMQYQLQPGDWQHMSYYTFLYSLYRNMKKCGNFALMETTPSSSFVTPSCRLKRPGQLESNVFEAVANGADAISFFQWRAGRGGLEQYHGSIITHDGRSDTRVAADVKALNAKLQRVAGVRTARVKSDCAIWFDPENSWLINASRLPKPKFALLPEAVSVMRGFLRNGVSADVISEPAQMSAYKLIVAPSAYLMNNSIAGAMEKFVQAGGTLLLTAFSGWSDENGLSFHGSFPGLLRNLAGLRVENCDVADDGESGSIASIMQNAEYPPRRSSRQFFSLIDSPDQCFSSRAVAELVHLESARPLAWWQDDFFAGSPALSCNQYGAGQVYYMAGLPDDGFYKEFIRQLIGKQCIKQILPGVFPPDGVQFQLRSSSTCEWLFIINQSGAPQHIRLPEAWQQLSAELPEYGARVLKRSLTDGSIEILL